MSLEETSEEILYPSLTDRIKSTMVDFILLLLLMSFISMALDNYQEVPDWLRACLFISIFFVYEPLSQTLGCSLGNYMLGIRVRQASDTTKKINILQAYIRFFIKSLLGWISFFTIHNNPRRRAIHDMSAMTVMIYA